MKSKPLLKTKKTKPSRPERHHAPKHPGSGVRLNRYLARTGLCSRREADRRIAAGRISINGEAVQDMGRRVKPGDVVLADKKLVEPVSQYTYIMYHKPRGLLCSRRDDRGRPLIYNELDVAANVQSVGRLDMDSEGLLLLTDDGDLTRTLTHPGARISRCYRVRMTGQLAMEDLQTLRSGGLDIGPDEKSDAWNVIVDSESKGHSWITITIHRGRWREVRRTLKACGHTVRRLIRVSFASLQLGDLPGGGTRPLKAGEIHQLKKISIP